MEDVGIFMAILFILLPNGMFHVHLVHFVVIWYISPVLVCCTEKNLATLNRENLLQAFHCHKKHV
jgi:hypothetical protein